MANQKAPSPEGNPFDIARIRQLVRLMRDNDLSEVDLRWEESRVRLRRGPDNHVAAQVTPPVSPTPAPSESSHSAPPETKAPSTTISITSPIVGTFYSASSPDAEPFAKVGSKVSSDTIVCIIEAMKVFNEIPAGISGTIAEVVVENGAPVEYGQEIFRVEP